MSNNTNELNKEQFKKQLNKKQFNKNNIDTEEVKHKINVRDISAELNDISQEMNIKELSIEKHKRISELAEENRKYNPGGNKRDWRTGNFHAFAPSQGKLGNYGAVGHDG